MAGLQLAGSSWPPRERGELLAAEGRTRDAPASLGRFGEDYPGPRGLCRVSGDPGDDFRRVCDKAPLAGPVQCPRRRQHLDPHRPRRIGSGGVDRPRIQTVDISCRVVELYRGGMLNALSAKQRQREVFCNLTVHAIWKQIARGIDVDHRHKRQHTDALSRLLAETARSWRFGLLHVSRLGDQKQQNRSFGSRPRVSPWLVYVVANGRFVWTRLRPRSDQR